MEPPSQLITAGALKNLSYIAAFLVAVEYLGLSSTAVGMLAVLLIIDFITGVIRAGFVDGAKTLRSSTGMRGMVAKAIVFIIPFVLAIAGRGAGMDLTAIAASSITIFILSTTYSILGNIHSLSTGKPKQEIDAISWLYRTVGDMLKKIMPDDDVK